MYTKILLFCIIILAGTISAVKSQASFDRQGHRGCRGLMPENSIPAMEKAVDLGVTLEMDISFSSEKIAIVSHDQYISSVITLKPNGDTVSKDEERQLILYNMPYNTISKYVFGVKPYPKFPEQKKIRTYIPKLADLIDSVETYAKVNGKTPPAYNIETKTTPIGDDILHPSPDEFVGLLMNIIKSKGIKTRVIIQSFDPRTLEIMHKKYPDVKTSLLVSTGSLDANLATLTFIPTIYSPDYKIVDQKTVNDCHDKGIKIMPWTVDDDEIINRLKKLGVDGIISDYPDKL